MVGIDNSISFNCVVDNKMNSKDYAMVVLKILIIIFALFILYQLVKFLLGGSWEKEDLIIALLVFNISITIPIGFSHFRLMAEHNHLANQFRSLVTDFKKLSEDVRKLSLDINKIKMELKTLSSQVKKLDYDFRKYIPKVGS